MKNPIKKFDISKIQTKMPISYLKMEVDSFEISTTIKKRYAQFDNYKAKKSKCIYFYKPISRIINNDNE